MRVTQMERAAILQMFVLPDGVSYLGEQPDPAGGSISLYHDVVTGSSFMVHEGENIEQAVNRIRESFFPEEFKVWEA